MNKITPCLWFNGDAEEAAKLYITLLPDSRIDRIFRSPIDTPGCPAGAVLTVEFTLGGNKFLGLNGGPQFKFTEAISFQIHCADQAEVDRHWSALSKDGIELGCGWVKDKWGLAWQIVPDRLTQLLNDPDESLSRRVMEAMVQMVRIDIVTLERAALGK